MTEVFLFFLENPHKPPRGKRKHLVIKAAAPKNIRGELWMKKLSNQEMKKIAKSTLALVLAGTFTFSPIAMAEENDSDVETVELQTVSPEEIEEAKTQVSELEETNPTLIPGDFFYFAKIALEKIRLAFTFDDVKEAELLATYAAERLAEAGALFADGKEDEALKVIEAAVTYMESSQDIVDEGTSDDEQADNNSEDEPDVEDEATSDESAEEMDSEESVGDVEEVADEVVVEDQEDENADDGQKEDVVSEDPFEEIEGMLRQNIIALKAAMEHVGNDNARAQLQKNIDKTYAKMSKKLAKLEEKYAEKPVEEEDDTETTEPTESEPVVESDLLPADETTEGPQETEETEKTMPADDDINVIPAAVPVKADTAKAKAKQVHKAEKAVEKQVHKAEKAVRKKERNEAKHQVKNEKHLPKQEKKPNQHSEKGKKAQDHGKGNNKH